MQGVQQLGGDVRRRIFHRNHHQVAVRRVLARMASSCSNSPTKTRRSPSPAARRPGLGALGTPRRADGLSSRRVVGRGRDRHEEAHPRPAARRGAALRRPGQGPAQSSTSSATAQLSLSNSVLASRHAATLLRAASPGPRRSRRELPQVLIGRELAAQGLVVQGNRSGTPPGPPPALCCRGASVEPELGCREGAHRCPSRP